MDVLASCKAHTLAPTSTSPAIVAGKLHNHCWRPHVQIYLLGKLDNSINIKFLVQTARCHSMTRESNTAHYVWTYIKIKKILLLKNSWAWGWITYMIKIQSVNYARSLCMWDRSNLLSWQIIQFFWWAWPKIHITVPRNNVIKCVFQGG